MRLYLRTEIEKETDPKRELSIPAEFVEFQPFNKGIDFRAVGSEELESINITPDYNQFVYRGVVYEFCFVYPD